MASTSVSYFQYLGSLQAQTSLATVRSYLKDCRLSDWSSNVAGTWRDFLDTIDHLIFNPCPSATGYEAISTVLDLLVLLEVLVNQSPATEIEAISLDDLLVGPNDSRVNSELVVNAVSSAKKLRTAYITWRRDHERKTSGPSAAVESAMLQTAKLIPELYNLLDNPNIYPDDHVVFSVVSIPLALRYLERLTKSAMARLLCDVNEICAKLDENLVRLTDLEILAPTLATAFELSTGCSDLPAALQKQRDGSLEAGFEAYLNLLRNLANLSPGDQSLHALARFLFPLKFLELISGENGESESRWDFLEDVMNTVLTLNQKIDQLCAKILNETTFKRKHVDEEFRCKYSDAWIAAADAMRLHARTSLKKMDQSVRRSEITALLLVELLSVHRAITSNKNGSCISLDGLRFFSVGDLSILTRELNSAGGGNPDRIAKSLSFCMDDLDSLFRDLLPIFLAECWIGRFQPYSPDFRRVLEFNLSENIDLWNETLLVAARLGNSSCAAEAQRKITVHGLIVKDSKIDDRRLAMGFRSGCLNDPELISKFLAASQHRIPYSKLDVASRLSTWMADLKELLGDVTKMTDSLLSKSGGNYSKMEREFVLFVLKCLVQQIHTSLSILDLDDYMSTTSGTVSAKRKRCKPLIQLRDQLSSCPRMAEFCIYSSWSALETLGGRAALLFAKVTHSAGDLRAIDDETFAQLDRLCFRLGFTPECTEATNSLIHDRAPVPLWNGFEERFVMDWVLRQAHFTSKRQGGAVDYGPFDVRYRVPPCFRKAYMVQYEKLKTFLEATGSVRRRLTSITADVDSKTDFRRRRKRLKLFKELAGVICGLSAYCEGLTLALHTAFRSTAAVKAENEREPHTKSDLDWSNLTEFMEGFANLTSLPHADLRDVLQWVRLFGCDPVTNFCRTELSEALEQASGVLLRYASPTSAELATTENIDQLENIIKGLSSWCYQDDRLLQNVRFLRDAWQTFRALASVANKPKVRVLDSASQTGLMFGMSEIEKAEMFSKSAVESRLNAEMRKSIGSQTDEMFAERDREDTSEQNPDAPLVVHFMESPLVSAGAQIPVVGACSPSPGPPLIPPGAIPILITAPVPGVPVFIPAPDLTVPPPGFPLGPPLPAGIQPHMLLNPVPTSASPASVQTAFSETLPLSNQNAQSSHPGALNKDSMERTNLIQISTCNTFADMCPSSGSTDSGMPNDFTSRKRATFGPDNVPIPDKRPRATENSRLSAVLESLSDYFGDPANQSVAAADGLRRLSETPTAEHDRAVGRETASDMHARSSRLGANYYRSSNPLISHKLETDHHPPRTHSAASQDGLFNMHAEYARCSSTGLQSGADATLTSSSNPGSRPTERKPTSTTHSIEIVNCVPESELRFRTADATFARSESRSSGASARNVYSPEMTVGSADLPLDIKVEPPGDAGPDAFDLAAAHRNHTQIAGIEKVMSVFSISDLEDKVNLMRLERDSFRARVEAEEELYDEIVNLLEPRSSESTNESLARFRSDSKIAESIHDGAEKMSTSLERLQLKCNVLRKRSGDPPSVFGKLESRKTFLKLKLAIFRDMVSEEAASMKIHGTDSLQSAADDFKLQCDILRERLKRLGNLETPETMLKNLQTGLLCLCGKEDSGGILSWGQLTGLANIASYGYVKAKTELDEYKRTLSKLQSELVSREAKIITLERKMSVFDH